MTNADTFLTDGFAPFQNSMILVTMGQYPNEKDIDSTDATIMKQTYRHKQKHYTHLKLYGVNSHILDITYTNI